MPTELEVQGEEALAARPALSPYTPTRAEREAHEATRMPFRNWCWACVQGRSDNPPHRAVPGVEEERRRLPELHFDYAFLRREDSAETITILIMKSRPSRAIRAWVVPCKGASEPATVDRIYRGICETGVRPPCIFQVRQ